MFRRDLNVRCNQVCDANIKVVEKIGLSLSLHLLSECPPISHFEKERRMAGKHDPKNVPYVEQAAHHRVIRWKKC